MRPGIQELDCALYPHNHPDNPQKGYWTIVIEIPEGPELGHDWTAGLFETHAQSPFAAIAKLAHLVHEFGFSGWLHVADFTLAYEFALIRCESDKPTVRYDRRAPEYFRIEEAFYNEGLRQ